MLAFWHTWIVRWWQALLFQMRLWPVIEVDQWNLLTFDFLGWWQVSWISVSPLPSLWALSISYAKLLEFLPISLGLSCYYFYLSEPHFLSLETGSCWFCCLRSTSCAFWVLFGKGVQTVPTSQISRQTWALLWLVTLASWKFYKGC